MFKLRGERSGTGVFGHLSFSPGMCFMGLRGVHRYATPVARQKPPFMQPFSEQEWDTYYAPGAVPGAEQ